jgi:hypothetical protein
MASACGSSRGVVSIGTRVDAGIGGRLAIAGTLTVWVAKVPKVAVALPLTVNNPVPVPPFTVVVPPVAARQLVSVADRRHPAPEG